MNHGNTIKTGSKLATKQQQWQQQQHQSIYTLSMRLTKNICIYKDDQNKIECLAHTVWQRSSSS